MASVSRIVSLPEGLVPEARTIALEMGLRAESTAVHLLAGLLLRRDDLLLLILDDARADGGRLRVELEERIAEGRIEAAQTNKTSLRFIMNQGVLLAQKYRMKRVTTEHMTASIVDNHANPASNILMERGVSMDVAKRWVNVELTAEGRGGEEPEMLMKRIARRLEGRCRVRFPTALLNRLVILGEEYFSAKGDRGEQLALLVRTIAAEVMTGAMPEALRELHLNVSDAKRKAADAAKTGKTTTRRRSLLEELRSRENYLRSLADWLEKQPHMAVDDEAVRRAVASVAGVSVSEVRV